MSFRYMSAYVAEEQYERLRRLSYERRRKMADMIREALDVWLTTQAPLLTEATLYGARVRMDGHRQPATFQVG